MNTPVYNSFVEKDAEFIDIENSKIETREELDSFISRYIGNNNYLYRGINTLTLRHQSLREEKKGNRTVILTFVVLRKD